MTELEVWAAGKLGAEGVTAVCTIASAAYWIRSAKARVPVAAPGTQLDADGWEPTMISGSDAAGEFDRFASLDEQSRLSAIAARWAAGAAIGVALATFVDIFVR